MSSSQNPANGYRARSFTPVLLFFAVGVVLALTVWALSAGVIHIRTAFFVLFLLVMTASCAAIYRHKFYGFFSPVVWTSLGLVYFLIAGPLLYPQNLISISKPANLPYYFAVLSLGVVSYYLGSYLASKTDFHFNWRWFQADLDAAKVFNRACVVILVYFCLLLVISNAGGFGFIEYITLNVYLLGDKQHLFNRFDGGYGYYLILMSRYFPILITLPSVFLLKKDLRLWKKFLLIAGLLLVFIITFYSGGRMRLAIWLGGIGAYLILAWGTGAGSIDIRQGIKKFAPIVLAGGLLIFLLTTVQIGFRNQRANLGEGSIDLGAAVFDNLLDDKTDQNVTLYTAVIADRDNRLEHLLGESYALTFVAFIPRAIWADKPGGDSMYEKLDVINPWESNQNISHTFIGELIYNFGVVAVVPGMVFIGLIQGMIFNQFLQYKSSHRMLIFYSALLIPFAFFVRGTFHAVFSSVLYPFLALILILL